jgi:hypothetical protein
MMGFLNIIIFLKKFSNNLLQNTEEDGDIPILYFNDRYIYDRYVNRSKLLCDDIPTYKNNSFPSRPKILQNRP